MKMRLALLTAATLLLAACAAAAGTPAPAWTDGPGASDLAEARLVEVYKSPACTCCHEWEAYLRGHGYAVRSIPTDDMVTVKERFGLPDATWSCHTAVVEGYAVEGHVPVEAIEDLLATRPAADAIVLPGMPPGSPGMPRRKAGSFEVLAVDDGRIATFGAY